MEWIFQPSAWASLAILTILEIILGIDNIIFISILAGKLPEAEQAKGRLIGLSLALITRMILLFSITWVMSLTQTLFVFLGREVNCKDLILIGGGLFLIAKSTTEIHNRIEQSESHRNQGKSSKLWTIVIQIMLLDIVFSIDSVITAVGMAQQLGIMIGAVVIAMIVMMAASGAISRFVNQHPTIKMLALAFLIMIGVVLVADGIGQHIDRGYVYFAMAFSTVVEMLNIRVRRKN